MTVQFIDAAAAAKKIDSGITVAVGGFSGFGLPEDILCELEDRYGREQQPRGLQVVTVAGLNGDGKDRGINHFAHEGLVGRFFSSNLSLAPKMRPLVRDNAFPAYMIPQGVMSHMMRAIAAHRPGVISAVGLHTYVDPRLEGGRMNEAAVRENRAVVDLIELRGEEYLFYPSFPIDIALVKGTRADARGNISIEKEAIHIEQLEMAEAAHNSGGIVMVQVDKVVPAGEIHPQQVTIPGSLVDYVIEGRPENSRQYYDGDCHTIDSWCGDETVPLETIEPLPFDYRKVISRRAAMEVAEEDFINLGIGIPTGIADILNEEGLIDRITISTESGVIGGVAAQGITIGAAYNPEAIIKQPDIFDLYDGGGIDFTGLGAAEIDRAGNVNSSRFAGRAVGPGGFINISQGARNVCFLGTFTSGHPDIRIEDGRLRIEQEGRYRKFMEQVEQITFAAKYSLLKGHQRVLYITERAVFELTGRGLTLTEIAPGMDLERDIFGAMDCRPAVSDDLKTMDERLFRPEPMGLRLKPVRKREK
jgi:propionate CoA-transferase